MQLRALVHRARDLHGESLAVQCGATAWSYGELSDRACGWAAAVAARGLLRGDRVALLHGNCHRFLQAALGAVAGGYVLVPLNVRLDAASLAEMLGDCGARLLVAEPSMRDLAAAAGARAGVAVTAPADLDGVAATGADLVDATPDDPAQIYYTSGTTGRPRGVVLTHRNIGSHALMTIAELGLSGRDVWGHVAPMFHLADAWAVFAITWVGGRHAMFPKFDPDLVLDGFAERGMTITNLVPAMLARLVDGAARRSFPALRLVMSGGAPIAPALVARIRAAFRAPYVQTYGLTETSPYLTFSLPTPAMEALCEEDQLRLAARTGRPALGVELAIVDAAGDLVPRDDRSVGEVRVRAPWVTPGYWNRPGDTAAAFAGGWFCTGDLATWDRHGSINIVDRKKDMIISGGEKVFSVEVEQALAAHPLVLECAVVGVPDAEWGEAVWAAVVPRGDAAPDAADLAAFVRARVAGFKVPKRFVVLPDLPKTGSGKIRKADLRTRLASPTR
ncbi:MAG: AMP-binding protein [Acidobacteriota bacterium]